MILFLQEFKKSLLDDELNIPITKTVLPSNPTAQIPSIPYREIGSYQEIECESIPLPTSDGGVQKYLSIFADKW